VGDIVAKVDEGHQNFIHWQNFTRPPVFGQQRAFAVWPLSQAKPTTIFQLREDFQEQIGQDFWMKP
jgi:hypothetical protein